MILRRFMKHVTDQNWFAVGLDVIVVITGIFLGMQVTEWTIKQQEQIELHGYLKNIKNNLQTDLRTIDEIKTFRDSSIALSEKYLKIAKKEEITPKDFNSIWPSNYNVFWDIYFKSHQSGFEVLKNSGFIGKLSGTRLEAHLNEYYYLLDVMREKEISLNNTIETMENHAFSDNILQRINDIEKMENKDEFFSSQQREIKELFNHPSMTAANFRNAGALELPQFYREMESLAKSIIFEIDNIVNSP